MMSMKKAIFLDRQSNLEYFDIFGNCFTDFKNTTFGIMNLLSFY